MHQANLRSHQTPPNQRQSRKTIRHLRKTQKPFPKQRSFQAMVQRRKISHQLRLREAGNAWTSLFTKKKEKMKKPFKPSKGNNYGIVQFPLPIYPYINYSHSIVVNNRKIYKGQRLIL